MTQRNADADPRYPAFTNGWFQVAWSRELPPGAVRSLRYFGQDLVLYRGSSGTAHVLDAHCPHLGAHLGVGGKVVDDCLECPFHGWQFDGGGQCARIPYARKIPPKATLGSWPLVERDGMIFVWRHHARRDPDRALPQVGGYVAGEWSGWSTYALTLRARSLDILENSVDSPHFEHVHNNGPTQPEIVRSGAILELKQRTSARLLGVSVGTTLHYQLIEPGFHYLHVNGLPIGSVLVVSSLVPIDERNVVNRLSIALRKRVGGVVGQAVSRLLCMAIARQMIATYEQDRPIWENKIFLSSPALCAGDGPLPLLRKWYATHAPAAEAAASSAATSPGAAALAARAS
jgi:3-ketosteroid 9alpha-monooxygenase subunit A